LRVSGLLCHAVSRRPSQWPTSLPYHIVNAVVQYSIVDMDAVPVRQCGGAMLSGAKLVGRPSMLFMFFRPQYLRRLSMPCAVQ